MVYQVVELPSEHWTCGAIVHVSVYKWNAGCYIYVTRFAKTRHNSAYRKLQYKALQKLSTKNAFHK